jgi:hypothetical protein
VLETSLCSQALSAFNANMSRFTIIFYLAFSLTTVAASEKTLIAQEINAALNNVTLHSTENGRAIKQVFQSSGVTFTIDVKTKAQSLGFWRLEANKYCSQWPPSEHWACYDVMANQYGVVFVSSTGTRYQMTTLPAP